MAVTIKAGESRDFDGVTYTATNDAVLNLDDAGKVSGIASGSVQAVVSGAESSPTVTFDATDEPITLKATSDGSVITITQRFPIELISGEFTYKGNTMTTSVGAKLANVGKRGDYSLRNENTFEFGGTYTFTDTALITESQHTISQFTLTNGNDVRTLNLEAFGTVINNFAEQGFTLTKGSSEVMHIGDYTLTATAQEDAGLNIELNENGVTLIPNKNDGSLNVALTRNGTEIFVGDLECTSGSITFGFDKAVTFAENTSFNFKWNDYVTTISTTDAATTDIALTDTGISFTPHDGDGALNFLITKSGTPIFGGALNVTSGTVYFDSTTQKISFTEGTKIQLGIGNQELGIEVVGGNASIKVEADGNGNFTITPDENDGSLDVTFKRDGEITFQNNLSVNGTMIFNPLTNLLTLKDGTIVSLAFKDYTLTATAQGDAASTISMSADGIFIMPQKGDGTLNLTLTGTSSGSLSANIEVLSGSFLFGLDGALTVTEGTELKIDFGDGYIVNFKATDSAGGAISIGADGLTFAPNSDDGSLELSITRDGQTHSTRLDATGSVTYKLDGSISLTKGTVVRSVFDSGNILTITANTDASGSIIFNPQTGLDITPSTPDALSLLLSTESEDIIKIASITGSINYINRTFTANDGTSIHFVDPAGYYSDNVLRTAGGTTSLQFADNGIVYTANDGATFTMDYLQGTTWELQQGTITDNFSGANQGMIILSEGAIFDTNDKEFPFTLGAVGNYTINGMNVMTSAENVDVLFTNYDTITFAQDLEVDITTAIIDKELDVKVTATQGQGTVTANDGKITYDATNGTLQITTGIEEIFGKSILADTFDISGGTMSFDSTNNKITCAAGSTLSFTQSGQVITLTTTKDFSATYKVEDEIYYLMLDDSATANVTVTRDGQKIVGGEMEIGGVFSYRPETGSFGLTGANSSHGDGTNTFFQFAIDGQKSTSRLETNDTTIVFIPTLTDDKYEINFPNERKHAMKLTITRDGQTIFENKIAIDGVVGLGTSTQELTLNKGTVLTLTQGDNVIEITALEDAGGQLTFIEGGIRFVPNANDGALELNFVTAERKANLNITGAIILGDNGKISLEDGTQVNLDWEDGANLKLTSTGSTGSITLGEKGIQITTDDENLDIDLTLANGVQTHFSGIKGTIYYNAGKVSFEENSKITATTTLGGQPVLITIETIGGTGHFDFNTSNGVIYSADTGAMKITWSRDDLESTFTVNNGSVQIGHGLFQIAEGTDLATDLKNLVPALYFTTSDAGTYTINGQTITTSAANLSMTATDDYMTFTTSDNLVEYDGMLFAGAGKVSLTPNSVVLGAGVEAEGFGKDKSFVLAESGNVTADARIFELTEDVPTGLTVTGAQDGFIFSRTNTEESESRFQNPNYDNVGKIFTEEFSSAGDSSYRIQTDLLGLQQIIGVTAPATVIGSASFDGEPEETIFDVVTNSEGEFTVGEKAYTISGDSSVGIMADFEPDKSYVRGFKDLSGTVSGDFTEHAVTINGGKAISVYDDTLIDISADEGNLKISGLDEGASLQVSEAGTYKVNETALKAKANDIIVGLKNSAYIYDPNNPLITTKTPTDEIIQQITGGDSSINVTVASGRENISLTGGDLVVVEETPAKVNITASKGNDTIVSKGENVSIKLNSTGKTDLFATGGRMTLEGYDAATGTGFGTNYSDILTAIENKNIDFDKGKLTIDSAVVNFDKDSELIDFYDAKGELQKVGYAAGDESLNASKQTEDLILFAEKYSTITGGAGSDSIFADAGSYVDAGAGKNYIKIEEVRPANDDGAIINIINGKNTIANFNAGFDDSSDVIENSSKYWDNKFDGTDIIIKTNGGKTVISNVGSGEEFVKFKQSANGYEYKVALAQKNSVIVASNDTTNVYKGEKSGVDFTGFEDSLLVNLNENAEGRAVDESIYFHGINRVTLGGGQNTLISSSRNETLTSSNGSTEFIFAKDSGRDLIQNFNFDGDKINVGNETITAVNVNNAGGVRMEISGSAILTLENAQGKNFQINNFVALVDKNLTYNDAANYYVATLRNATLTVGEGAQIWLDGSHGKTFVGDIRTLDATTSTGKAELAGNDLDNKIFAGNGDASLWGGNGGDDILTGGAGKNSFFYTNGNGFDTIGGTNAGDLVYLSEITLEQIASTNVTNNIATINFKDGGRLTINDAANCSYVLTQGDQAQIYKINESGFVNA